MGRTARKVAAKFRGNQGRPNIGVIPANRTASTSAKQKLDARWSPALRHQVFRSMGKRLASHHTNGVRKAQAYAVVSHTTRKPCHWTLRPRDRSWPASSLMKKIANRVQPP